MPLDKVLGFFADNKEVTQLIAKSVPAIMGFHQANKSKNAIEDYQTKLDDIEKNRQQIVNPYANVTNPFANMQVATKAAEMQAEQADISLANTLDNLRQTGAGGATALAQAALRSKQGVSADIQKQETQNQKLYAQGQQQMEIAKAQGKQAAFNMQENRDVRDTYRLQMQMDMAQQQRAAGLATGAAALASGIGGLSTFINPEARNTETTNSANQRAASNAQTNLLNLQNQQGIVQQLPTTAPPTVMVPGATTLGQYYQGLGQSLPSQQDRAPLYEQFGLGSASSYEGNEDQNIELLEYLQNQ